MASQQMESMFKHEDDISKEEALNKCREFMPNEWTDVQISDFNMTVIRGGFVNRIFLCENGKTGFKVLLRLYGGKCFTLPPDKTNETLVYYALSRESIAPKLFGVWQHGRLEQYVPNSDILSDDDINDPLVLSSLAYKLSRMHSLSVPLRKEPMDIMFLVEKSVNENWAKHVELLQEDIPEDMPQIKQAAEFIRGYDVNSLVQWFKEMLPKIKTRIVLAHMDLTRGNMLIRKDTSNVQDKVVLVDFEGSGYGYRGLDFGVHFHSRKFNLKEFLKGKLVQHEYPDEENRRSFIRMYLDHLRENPSHEWDDKVDDEYILLLESEFFAALYQFMIQCWFIEERDERFLKFVGTFIEIAKHPSTYVAGILTFIEERRRSVLDLIARRSL